MKRPGIPLLLSLTVWLGGSLAFAQEPDAADPPDSAARLSYLQGNVSIEPAGTEDWAAAVLNRPLTSGDKVWVDRESRAELQAGDATVHVDQSTGFSIARFDDQTLQMNVTDGTVAVNVRDLQRGESVEVDTPNATVSLVRPGQYRISVDGDGNSTRVAVRRGESEISGNGQRFSLSDNQEGSFSGTDRLSADVHGLSPMDDFDAWSTGRDRRDERSVSSQYVAPEVVGYQDLDDYGTWGSDPDYGNVWYPTTVAVGWAPYRFGHWIWIGPWGWTWVDDAPWGYAPFHYGRWAYARSRWCWVPGPRHVRPVYAPALVAWVGGGHGGTSISVTVGGGPGVGWFPLGPREVYVPRNRVSERYVQRVNVTNTTIVNNTYINNVYNNRVTNVRYVNQHAPGAVTAVSQRTFTSAQPVGRNTIRLNDRDVTALRASAAPPKITPQRESMLGASRPGAVVRPPPRVQERQEAIQRRVPQGPQQRPVMPLHGTQSDRPAVQTERPTVERRDDRPVIRQEQHRDDRPLIQRDQNEERRNDRPPQATQPMRQDRPERSDRPNGSDRPRDLPVPPRPQSQPPPSRPIQPPRDDRPSPEAARKITADRPSVEMPREQPPRPIAAPPPPPPKVDRPPQASRPAVEPPPERRAAQEHRPEPRPQSKPEPPPHGGRRDDQQDNR